MAPRKPRTRRPRRRTTRRTRIPKKISYPDQQNFKFELASSIIYNAAGVTRATGFCVLGTPTAQRTNYQQFGGTFNFNLASCMAYENFMKYNYDRYRINQIKLRFVPENNFSNVSGSGTLAQMKIVRDYDDAQIPTVGDVEIRRGKTYTLNKPFSITIKPKVGIGMYQSTITTNVVPASVQKAGWINMGYPMVPHYGLKFFLRDWFNAGNDLALRIQCTFYVSLREQIQTNRLPSLQGDDAPSGIEQTDVNQLEPEVPAPEPPTV